MMAEHGDFVNSGAMREAGPDGRSLATVTWRSWSGF